MILAIIVKLFQAIVFALIIYVSTATLYLLLLAISKIFVGEKILPEPNIYSKFCIIIPAYNEEMVIERLLKSVFSVNYPKENFEIYIIADNCTDRTVEISKKYSKNVLERNDKINKGKGYAIDFALKNININDYDSILIIDADNIVEKKILNELNKYIYNGSEVVQCYNGLNNREDSWFTELLYVSRTIVNVFYHEAKYRIGLSSYLMGNGMCFSKSFFTNIEWNAFSIGEDWEFYSNIINMGKKVDFAINARVYHLESKTMKQATSQRLRWSKGRFAVLKNSGVKMFLNGLKEMNLLKIDGALPLIFPNYSLLVNISFLSLVLNNILFYDNAKIINNVIILSCVFLQITLFFAGMYKAGKFRRSFVAFILSPLFLIWKMIIDVITMTGLYKGKKWVRTSRK